jgi:hypothetical protein
MRRRSTDQLPAGNCADDDRIAALERRVDTLERLVQRRPRDHGDLDVFHALARSIGTVVFTAKAVIAHAKVDSELKRALEAADCDSSPRSLGRLLRRVERRPIDNVMVIRCGASVDGIRWQIVSV